MKAERTIDIDLPTVDMPIKSNANVKAFAKALRTERTRRGLSRRALSEMVRCHPVYLAMLEATIQGNTHRATPRMLSKLEKAVGKHAGGRLWKAAGYKPSQIAFLRRHPDQYRETKSG